MAAVNNEYRSGFTDCQDMVEDIIGSVKRLKRVKSYLLMIQASVKEKKSAQLKAELAL